MASNRSLHKPRKNYNYFIYFNNEKKYYLEKYSVNNTLILVHV